MDDADVINARVNEGKEQFPRHRNNLGCCQRNS
jgi:hypothetical protein